MKTLFATAMLCIICYIAKSQSLEKCKLPLSPDSSIVYEKVIQLDSTYKTPLLYKAAKTWFVNNFKSAKAVIQSEDQQNGRFLGKCYFPADAGLTSMGAFADDCYFYIQIDVKDGKYRYRFYNFQGQGIFMNMPTNIDVSQRYLAYLNNRFPKTIFTSKEKLYKKLDELYAEFNSKMLNTIATLNATMLNSKQDEF